MDKDYFEGRSVDEEERRDELRYWSRVVVVILLAIGLGGAMHWAFAGEVKVLGTVENDAGTRVTLLDAPCDSVDTMALISGNLPEELQVGWKKVDAVFAMKPIGEIQRFEGCWLDVRGTVLLVFEDGDHFDLPRSAFKRVGVDA